MKKADVKILIADDDYALRRQFDHVLSGVGYDVTAVASGEEAHEALLSRHFDVALLDVQMGKVSGIALAGNGFFEYPETKIIMVTGLIGISESAVGRSGFPGSHATLFKPVRPDDLIEAVETLLSTEVPRSCAPQR